MWIGVLWAGPRVAMWITHVGGQILPWPARKVADPGLKFSSEIEHFKRATHQTPYFCGEFWRSRFKISSEIKFFKRD